MDKLIKIILFAASFLACITAYAQESIEGTWAGKLEAAPGNIISVHFVISKDAGGGWAAVLNSPDTGAIKDMKASAVSFDGTKLDIKVDALSGAYSGVFNNGTFAGEWTQPGSTLVMNLAPYAASVLSAEAMASLLGQWHGKMQGPGIVLNMVFHFERNEADEFVGSIQQIDSSPNKMPMTDISFENNELFFRVPTARAEYRATFADGSFKGHVKQGPQNMELNVVKGEYVAEAITLALNAADFDKLVGEWTGTLTPPAGAGELTLIMTFKRDETGAIAGTFQSPQQGNALLKITTASLTGNTLAVALAVPPASFTGELDGTSITGTWTQGPGSMPLTLTKK